MQLDAAAADGLGDNRVSGRGVVFTGPRLRPVDLRDLQFALMSADSGVLVDLAWGLMQLIPECTRKVRVQRIAAVPSPPPQPSSFLPSFRQRRSRRSARVLCEQACETLNRTSAQKFTVFTPLVPKAARDCMFRPGNKAPSVPHMKLLLLFASDSPTNLFAVVEIEYGLS